MFIGQRETNSRIETIRCEEERQTTEPQEGQGDIQNRPSRPQCFSRSLTNMVRTFCSVTTVANPFSTLL